MKNSNSVLSPEQVEQFVTEGYTVLKNAFSGEDAKAWVHEEALAVGIDVDDPSTWTKDYQRIPTKRVETVPNFSPVGWAAACELMGGEDRVVGGTKIDLFALNLSQGSDRPFEEPTPKSKGWHKDGWHFWHFLDSFEQGLLGIPLLTDVYPQGGATFIAARSVASVAKYLAARPEGVHPDDFPPEELLSEGIEFREATGEAGDFYLIHPYLLHAVSQNVLRKPRAISNILFELKAPMEFNRTDGDYSPVELAVLRGLGVESLEFKPTRERFRTPDYGPINPAYR